MTEGRDAPVAEVGRLAVGLERCAAALGGGVCGVARLVAAAVGCNAIRGLVLLVPRRAARDRAFCANSRGAECSSKSITGNKQPLVHSPTVRTAHSRAGERSDSIVP